MWDDLVRNGVEASLAGGETWEEVARALWPRWDQLEAGIGEHMGGTGPDLTPSQGAAMVDSLGDLAHLVDLAYRHQGLPGAEGGWGLTRSKPLS